MVQRLLAAPAFGGRVAPAARVEFTMRDVYAPTHWAIRGEPPAYDTPDEDVYLTGRNLVLLTKAGVIAASAGARRIALGPLAGNPFPDARPAFFAAMAQALSLGLDHPIEVVTPFMTWGKDQVIRRGAELGVPFELTLSCMRPVQGETGSGVQGFRGSEVQGFRGSEVQGFRGSEVQGFRGSGVQRFRGSRVQGFTAGGAASAASGATPLPRRESPTPRRTPTRRHGEPICNCQLSIFNSDRSISGSHAEHLAALAHLRAQQPAALAPLVGALALAPLVARLESAGATRARSRPAFRRRARR